MVWTRRAVRNLDSIFDHIVKDNLAAALRLGEEIQHRVALLADHPQLGRAGRLIGTRELVVHEHYVVPYRVVKGRVEILTVQHTRRLRS